MRGPLSLLPLLALSFGCAGASAARSGAEPSPVASAASEGPATCTPPFTADQIRSATRVGRTYDFELESPAAPPSGLRLRFVEVTPTWTRLERSTVDQDGQPTAPTRSSTVSWDELVRHAAWPLDATTIEPAHVTVPAGDFPDGLLYTVREVEGGRQKVTRAWFVKSMPGAPVVHVVEMNGVAVMKMRLVRYNPGP